MNCETSNESLNALLDGELPPAEAARITAHLANCPACAKAFSELAQLRADLATLIPTEEPPATLLARFDAMLEAEERAAPAAGNVIPLVPKKSRFSRGQSFGWVAAAAAVAAMLTVVSLPRHDNTNDLMSVRDAALRSTMTGHPAGAANGPTIPGYQLTSMRSDEVAGHPAQVTQYTANGQVFTLCVWQSYGEPAHGVRNAAYKGMKISYWADGDEEFWAASTAPAPQLQAFVAALSPS